MGVDKAAKNYGRTYSLKWERNPPPWHIFPPNWRHEVYILSFDLSARAHAATSNGVNGATHGHLDAAHEIWGPTMGILGAEHGHLGAIAA